MVTESLATTIGARIKALRKARGLTQGDLAEAIGAVQASITNYEAGRGIDVHVLEAITEALDVKLHSLTCADADPVKLIAEVDLSHIPLKTIRLLSTCDNAAVLALVEKVLLSFEELSKERKS